MATMIWKSLLAALVLFTLLALPIVGVTCLLYHNPIAGIITLAVSAFIWIWFTLYCEMMMS